ncbi:hypothetical protein GTW40_28450 [Streptomyces sp. SID4985]|uniref:hypothetical protein n=1 Tax=Streptomyces sp. SID4985 TaxID=2690292 RepID=UPI00136BFA71|nr:hypothetical protein [Streptomyces sp. SID4985]MYQ48913.1 hypothetical protein [Streptomyces sp. SID4985]
MPADAHDAFEQRLPAALDDAAQDLPPLPPGLLERAARRGRRRRMWRAAQVGGGAALTVAALGGALVGTGVLGGTGTPAVVPGRAATAASADPVPSVSGNDVAATLRSLMPKGGTVSQVSGTRTPDALSAKLVHTGAGGASTALDLTISRQQAHGCLPVEVRPYDTCTTKRFPDGSVLYSTKSFTYPNSPDGQRRWYAEYLTGDGVQLFLEEFGGGGEKESASGVEPGLSLERLGEIVRSPAWLPAGSSLPARDGSEPAPTQPEMPSADRMTSLLTALLPKGHVSDVNSSPGTVQLVHDDGAGKTMVEVDVQPDRGKVLARHMDCEGDHLVCDSVVLKDGTKVKMTRSHSEKGGKAAVWQVDTLRPDGLRVLVREINSYAEAGPVTRPRPVLGMERLRVIALDERWRP